MMKGIQIATKIGAKIMEIGHWIVVGMMSAIALVSLAAPQLLQYLMDVEALRADGLAEAYGFEVYVGDGTGGIRYPVLCLFAIGAAALFVLMALVFRNLSQIVGRSENGTPFCEKNIASLRRMGRCSILVPLVGLLMSIVIRGAIGPEACEVSMDLSNLFMGFVILCLTEYFIHGAKLEQEVDGLV